MVALTTSGPGVTHEREDLINYITRIDPAEVPFYSNMPKGSAKAIRHDWTVQELAAVDDANAVAEAHDATFDALLVPDRFDNFTQIHQKDGQVSGTYDAVDTVGQARETARQKILKGLEMRRDVESTLSNNTAKVGPGGTRRSGGFHTWTTNGSVGATGSLSSGDSSDTATVGTPRAFATADLIEDAMEQCYNTGGNPTALYMRPASKRKFSDLPDAWADGVAHRVNATSPSAPTYVGAVDAFRTDFGVIEAIVSRFIFADTASTNEHMMLVDNAHIKCCPLPGRNFITEDLGKTGDSRKFHVIAELCLEVDAPKAHASILALDTTL